MKMPDWLTRLYLYPFFRPYVSMPGRKFRGKIAPLLAEEFMLRDKLQERMHVLVDQIGERSIARPQGLKAAEQYIIKSFDELGYTVWRQPFYFGPLEMSNLFVEKIGSNPDAGSIVIGAHYDTVIGTPGADDNATGVAALLELARWLKHEQTELTVRLVAFSNEENNGSDGEEMGSNHFAGLCVGNGYNVQAMLSLEMLGVYSDDVGSQQYPHPLSAFYPRTGNFIAFVGNQASKPLVQRCVSTWRESVQFPCEGIAAPDKLRDAARSDHLNFWKIGVPALMVTDTSNFRYPLYHTPHDTVDKIDFDRYTRVVSGLFTVVRDLANGQ